MTATRLPQPLAAGGDVSGLAAKQIDEFAGGSVTDILPDCSPASISTNGGRGQLSSIFCGPIRQTVVLIDGVRVNSATSGGAALEKLPLDQVERIEVLRGGQFALWRRCDWRRGAGVLPVPLPDAISSVPASASVATVCAMRMPVSLPAQPSRGWR